MRLNSLRKERGMSAAYMAQALFVSLRTYRKYESGDILPPLDTLVRIADILDVSLDVLMGRDEFIARHGKEKV